VRARDCRDLCERRRGSETPPYKGKAWDYSWSFVKFAGKGACGQVIAAGIFTGEL